MQTTTRIEGKDAPLEKTIYNINSLLSRAGIKIEPTNWINPTENCWSVHLRTTSHPLLYTNGKGTSKLSCLASALGEFVERLTTNFFFADSFLEQSEQKHAFIFFPNERWFAPGDDNTIPKYNKDGEELLSDALLQFYNPENELTPEHLYDNNSPITERGICALPFLDITNNRTTYFPVSLLNNLYVSNGMAAGNSPAECCSQALSEIIERYVKNIIISKGICLPDVPHATLAKHPKLLTIIKDLSNHNLNVQVKDASLGGNYPVICVLLTNLNNGGVFASFGSNLRFEIAIERTLTELLQGRNLDQLCDFQPPSHDLVSVADPFNLESHFINSDGLLSWEMFKDTEDYPFHHWDFTGPTEKEFKKLCEIITNLGFSIFRAEYQQHGMYCCRLLVPGMSEIYPLEDLVWNNKSTGTQLRQHLLDLPFKQQNELRQLLTLLDELGVGDHQLISDIIGVHFDENSTWATLRISELKCLLHLAIHNQQEALEWCNWCVDFGALPEPRLKFFQLLQNLLHLSLAGKKVDEYKKHLLHLYSEKEFKIAWLASTGSEPFPGLNFGANWSEISASHKRLLEIYTKTKDAHFL